MYKQLYFNNPQLIKDAETLAQKNGVSLSKFTQALLQHAVDNQVIITARTYIDITPESVYYGGR